ncbi:MAG: hypothetical protein DWH91_04830 [Planctomycetota bacterium]|nr:MAG: hypothetical protein DWH91_04830 [Planctomycetota bacterium]
MGALLIMVPVQSDYMYQRNIVEMMSKSNVTSVNLIGQMSELYRFGCWATGTGMIAIAVLSSLFKTSSPPTEN